MTRSNRSSRMAASRLSLDMQGLTICGMRWRVILERDPESGDWAVWCPELPGCASAGQTEDEAMENIREAIELYLEQDEIDLPIGAVVREVTAG